MMRSSNKNTTYLTHLQQLMDDNSEDTLDNENNDNNNNSSNNNGGEKKRKRSDDAGTAKLPTRKSKRGKRKLLHFLPPDVANIYRLGELTMIQAVAMAKDQQNNSTAMSNGSLSRQHRDTVENARQEVIDLTFDSDSDDNSVENTTVNSSNNETKNEVVVNGTMGSSNVSTTTSEQSGPCLLLNDGSKINPESDLDAVLDDNHDIRMEDDTSNNMNNNDSLFFNRPFYILLTNRWYEGSAKVSDTNGEIRIIYTNKTAFSYRTFPDYHADIIKYKAEGKFKWKDEVNDEEKQQLSVAAMQPPFKEKSKKSKNILIQQPFVAPTKWKPTCKKDEYCTICLDYGSNFKLKGCGHVFHLECIQREIGTIRPKQKNENMKCSEKCPNCRKPILGNSKKRLGDEFTPIYSQKEETDDDMVQKDIDIIQAAINRGNRSPIAYHVDESYASSDSEFSDSPDDDDSTMESLNHFPRNELGHTGTLRRSVVAGHPLWSCCYLPHYARCRYANEEEGEEIIEYNKENEDEEEVVVH